MRPLLRRYRWWLLAASLAVAGLALTGWWTSAPASRFTREQYANIRFGMSEGDVRAIMGCPPTGNKAAANYWNMWNMMDFDLDLNYKKAPVAVRTLVWCDGHARIYVGLCDERVQSKTYAVQEPAWWGKMRNWFAEFRSRIGI